MTGLPGGVAPSTASAEAIASLNRSIEQAFRMLPGGPGQGEGPLPSAVNAVRDTVLALYAATGKGQSLQNWLGMSLDIDAGDVDTQAALAIRDIIAALQDRDPVRAPMTESEDAARAEAAAAAFGTVPPQADAVAKVRRLRPVRAFDCRPKPPPPDHIEAITRYHHYRDEREIRSTVYISLDQCLEGVIAPGDRKHVRPSTRLYGGQLDRITAAWENRWWTGRLVELGFFAISELLVWLGRAMDCQHEGESPANRLARTLGRIIHRRIQDSYLAAYGDSEVCIDGRVHFGRFSRSEKLSELAYARPSSLYGALNFSLMGRRADIINLDRREMWEIKPAALASEAILQLWGYLDNYEVARLFERYTRRAALPPVEPGLTHSLPRKCLEQFVITLPGTRVTLVVKPFTIPSLPGLILYTLRPLREARSSEAAEAVAVGRVVLQQLLVAGGRSGQQKRDAEIAFWENAQYVAAGVAITCSVIVVALATGGAGLGPAAELTAAEGAVVAGEVTSLAARRALLEASRRQAVVEMSKRAAGVVTLAAGGKLLQMPPELVGPSMETAMDLGIATARRSDQ